MGSVPRAVGITGVVLAAGLSMLTLGAGAPAPATRPAAAGAAAAPATRPAADPASSSPDLMLKQLLSGNRPKPALEPVEFERERRPDAATRPVAPPRAGDAESFAVIREGTYLVDRVGRLTRTPEGQQELTLEADGSGLKDPPLILLPNQKLMLMERYVRNSSRDLKFRITGMVTEYHGRNYILLEKMVVVDAGALSPVQANPALRRR